MAERKWTPAQKNAIEAYGGTVIVSAAAGSGKTSVLVERIIRKLTSEENAVAPDSLLVVTFTNAAAAEMRSRIYSGISKKAAQEPQRRNDYIMLLSRLSEMQVCTMDSFCMNLVRENSHALDIDADFRILEQGESAELKKKAAVRVLERRFTETPESFLPLAGMFDSGKNDTRLTETVIRLSDFSMSEPSPRDWLEKIREQFEAVSADESIWGKKLTDEVCFDLSYCIYLSDAALKDIEEDEELSAGYLGLFCSENTILKDTADNVKSALWDEKIDLVKHARDIIKSSRLPSLPRGYSDNPSKLSAQAKRNEIKDVLDKIIEYFNITDADNRDDLPVIGAIASELIDTVIEYNTELIGMKKEMSVYDFSDISHFALELLVDKNSPDNKTELAMELTDRFSEILIDEYQDTNRAQDGLFRAVSKNGKNMFLVGDVKQSIYRFRLASPEIFIEKCNAFPYYDGKSDESKIILGENFRSRKGILDTVNFVFSMLMSPLCGDIKYNEDERLNFPAVKEAENTVDTVVRFIDTGDRKPAETEADFIARTISEGIAGADCVADADGIRKAEPSDYCILLRSPSGVAASYIKALKNAGIPVSSDVNQSFFETPEIKTIMSYLRVIDNPGKDIDMLAVMMSPLFGFNADEAAGLRVKYGRKVSLYSAVLKAAAHGDKKCAALRDKISTYKALAACMPASRLIREIYSESAYPLAAGAMNDGEVRKKNLYTLLEKAEKSPDGFTEISAFIRYMDMLRENGADPGASVSGNGVKIMSMHKSKGLEFPFVFIAGSSKTFNKTDLRSNLIINHELGFGMKRRELQNIKNFDTLSSVSVRKINNSDMMSEELRIYYVALTRAKQKLYIPVALKKARKALDDTEYLLSNCDGIHPWLVRNASSASEWLKICFLNHNDSGRVRTARPVDKSPLGIIDIDYIEELPSDCKEITEERICEADAGLKEEIRRRASFRYKYADVASVLSKHTASTLRDEHFDPAGFGKSVPGFMYSETLSPADIGTLTHRFLQYCDFEVCKTDPYAECERLISEGRFTRKQAESVDMEAIRVFVNSDIMKRAQNADRIYREKQFTILRSICDTEKGTDEKYRDEKTVIIGKIDLVFIENGKAVIVDYKTDNVTDITVLSERYRQQMEVYAEALKKSLDADTDECILYSLKLKDSIKLDL